MVSWRTCSVRWTNGMDKNQGHEARMPDQVMTITSRSFRGRLMDGRSASCQPIDVNQMRRAENGDQCTRHRQRRACGAGGVGGDATCLQADEAVEDIVMSVSIICQKEGG